jgi:hypothetical protein
LTSVDDTLDKNTSSNGFILIWYIREEFKVTYKHGL